MYILIFTLLTFTTITKASELPLKFGGFLDTYYTYDFNNPKNHEREYTTQPVRHNEFNINLAYVDAVISQEKTRARLALQFGQSVTKNTTGEPRDGATSGPVDAKIFQEAFIGKKLGENTWLDFGIFLGNIGAESWISKDNWTYSRALNLDYVPYYSAGVRLEHQLNKKHSFGFQVLNGWQNMSENNHSKAIGMQYKYLLSEKITFTYNNFFGDEEVVSNDPRFRAYHNFILRWMKSERWQFLASFDVGHQAQKQNNGVDGWIATTLTIRRILNLDQSLALRAEYYSDPHEANILTGTENGFQVASVSLNFDQKLDTSVLWRNEIRMFNSKDEIYTQGGSNQKKHYDGFIVTSLSTWF